PEIARERVVLLERLRLDLPQERFRAERVAAVREGDDDAIAGADEGGELVLGLRQAAGGDCGPLRLEGMRLAGGERVELGSPGEGERIARVLLGPARAHLVR